MPCPKTETIMVDWGGLSSLLGWMEQQLIDNSSLHSFTQVPMFLPYIEELWQMYGLEGMDQDTLFSLPEEGAVRLIFSVLQHHHYI